MALQKQQRALESFGLGLRLSGLELLLSRSTGGTVTVSAVVDKLCEVQPDVLRSPRHATGSTYGPIQQCPKP